MTTQVKFLPRLRTHTREVKGKDWSEGKNGEWGWDAKNTFFSSRHTCPMGTWGPTHFARKYQAGVSYLTKPILRKKRLFCSLRSSERLLYLQAKKSLFKLNAETRVLTYWSWSVLCCGTVWGGLFPLLCSLPEPASNPDVSLSMKICAPRKAGRTKRLSSFSFLWLACVANVSARVNARKLETEQKKKNFAFSLSLCKFSRNNSSGNAC